MRTGRPAAEKKPYWKEVERAPSPWGDAELQRASEIPACGQMDSAYSNRFAKGDLQHLVLFLRAAA
jgi:hypothetical protein